MRLRWIGLGGGLSPRGRGKPVSMAFVVYLAGSIPAWAGETERAMMDYDWQEVYPRVGGGNWAGVSRLALRNGLSPRGRGKPPRGSMGRR